MQHDARANPLLDGAGGFSLVGQIAGTRPMFGA